MGRIRVSLGRIDRSEEVVDVLLDPCGYLEARHLGLAAHGRTEERNHLEGGEGRLS